jgi:hypothetical protein
MKKKILTVGFIITGLIVSCQKEEFNPNNSDKVCNCGLVVSDNVQDYSVVIRNSCSGNEKRFYLQEGDWMNAHPGSDYCITNVKNW